MWGYDLSDTSASAFDDDLDSSLGIHWLDKGRIGSGNVGEPLAYDQLTGLPTGTVTAQLDRSTVDGSVSFTRGVDANNSASLPGTLPDLSARRGVSRVPAELGYAVDGWADGNVWRQGEREQGHVG
jgi:hypothetical protein